MTFILLMYAFLSKHLPQLYLKPILTHEIFADYVRKSKMISS
jgi:hypothetical protein